MPHILPCTTCHKCRRAPHAIVPCIFSCLIRSRDLRALCALLVLCALRGIHHLRAFVVLITITVLTLANVKEKSTISILFDFPHV